MAKIIAIGMKKGGPGKSTIALNLAGVFANRGKKVAIWDCDTNHTCISFLNKRAAYRNRIEKEGLTLSKVPYIKPESKLPENFLIDDLEQAEDDYDYIIIDTGGYENDAFKDAVTKADFIYLPFIPSDADIEQLVPTLKVVLQIEGNIRRAIGNKEYKKEIRLLISRVTYNARAAFQEAREKVKDLIDYTSISSATIPEYGKIRKLYSDGLTLSDTDARGKKDPKRAVFELLADEIDGIRQVQYKRGEGYAED